MEARDDKADQTTILIVDDDQIVADSLATFLASEGHTVVTAPGVDEAIDLLERGDAGIDGASPIDSGT